MLLRNVGLVLCALCVLFGGATVWAAPRNTHNLPPGGDETRAILGEAFSKHVVEGCQHGTSGTTSVSLPSCRAYMAEPGPPRQWRYMEETAARTINYNTGNGTYWLIGHPSTTKVVGGWTRVPGTQYLWQMNAARPTIPPDALLLLQSTVAGAAITAVVQEAPRQIVVAQTISENLTTGARAPWVWPGQDAVLTIAATKTLTLGTCPVAGRWQIFAADGVTTGLVRFGAGTCGQVFPEWWGTTPTVFQEATDALTTWGGEVNLAQGVYTQNIVTAKSNVVYSGKGVGVTTWRLADAQMNWMYGQNEVGADVLDDQVINCGINNMTIDGNWTQNQSVSDSRGGIAPRGFTRCHFHHLHITNTRGDGIGTLVRTQDSIFEDLVIDFRTVTPPWGRSCVGVSGGSRNNVFQNIVCHKPTNTCFDFEPVNGVPQLWDMHFSDNKIHNWTCIEPQKNGFTSSFGNAVAAGFTGTRRGNSWSNLSVYRAGKHGFLLADLNENTMSNLTAIESSFLEPDGRGIWIGGYSTIGATNITLAGCNVRNTGDVHGGLFLSDGDTPAVVNHVAVSGCVVSSSGGADLVIDGVTNLSISGTSASKLDISGQANPISISTQGQGPAIASAAVLTPLGLYDTYLVTGSTQINEITGIAGWLGRTLQLTFDSTIVVAHDNDTIQTPIYLANQSTVTFCAGDTLTLRKTDVTSGETRWQEVRRSRAAAQVTITTGTTPSMACATAGRMEQASPTSVTTFTNTEANVTYTFWCIGTNTTLKDFSTGGNFNLATDTDFACTIGDTIQLRRFFGNVEFHEVGRSRN